MPRFFIPPSAINGKTFTLSGSEAHHALNVLRKKVGDEIDLFDGKDTAYTGHIESISGQEIHGSLLVNRKPQILPVQVTLFQGLTRGAKWEWLLEKACEIGVARVVPLFTRRSLIKLDAAQAKEKVKRWNRIALAASKQCGRTDLMIVEAPIQFVEALRRAECGAADAGEGVLNKEYHLPNPAPRTPRSLSLIPWEKETQRSIHAACQGYNQSKVNVFIGPEGGWDALEIDQARQFGAVPVRLGPTLLRTETAGIIAVTLVFREYGIY